ncbi:MAG: hypothetical protein NTZ05_16750, partial [Chloroflexi bacterium]|nr:hypothetical protein [Chloroflexota bacterium]
DAAATALGIVTYLEGAAGVADETPVAEVRAYDGDGGVRTWRLRAGRETAEGRYDSAQPAHRKAPPAAGWRSGGGTSYLAGLPLGNARYVQRVEVESLLDRGRVALHGLSLIDERLNTAAPVALDPALRLTYLGDLKVYDNLAWLPGAWAAFSAVEGPADEAARLPGVLPVSVLLSKAPDGPAAALVRPLAEAVLTPDP